MQFTLHATRRTPHGAVRLVPATSAWLVKTRRAPSRHGRDARVYGHTTTAMHKLRTPPPPTIPRRMSAHRNLAEIFFLEVVNRRQVSIRWCRENGIHCVSRNEVLGAV